ILEGVVTNVTAFGAFVDIGVHQDGLIHVSELSDRFIREPSEVVKAGDRIKVRVLSVDVARKRMSMSAKLKPSVAGGPAAPGGGSARADSRAPAGASRPPPRSGFSANPFANL
ncbi:MAG: S1 RNA-binding domain-containing protein, partial [bacterium]